MRTPNTQTPESANSGISPVKSASVYRWREVAIAIADCLPESRRSRCDTRSRPLTLARNLVLANSRIWPEGGGLPHRASQFAGKFSKCSATSGLSSQISGEVLNRFLSIFRDRIFDSNVDRGMPNLAAAPLGPNIRPRLSFRAASIISFSCATSLCGSSI